MSAEAIERERLALEAQAADAAAARRDPNRIGQGSFRVQTNPGSAPLIQDGPRILETWSPREYYVEGQEGPGVSPQGAPMGTFPTPEEQAAAIQRERERRKSLPQFGDDPIAARMEQQRAHERSMLEARQAFQTSLTRLQSDLQTGRTDRNQTQNNIVDAVTQYANDNERRSDLLLALAQATASTVPNPTLIEGLTLQINRENERMMMNARLLATELLRLEAEGVPIPSQASSNREIAQAIEEMRREQGTQPQPRTQSGGTQPPSTGNTTGNVRLSGTQSANGQMTEELARDILRRAGYPPTTANIQFIMNNPERFSENQQ